MLFYTSCAEYLKASSNSPTPSQQLNNHWKLWGLTEVVFTTNDLREGPKVHLRACFDTKYLENSFNGSVKALVAPTSVWNLKYTSNVLLGLSQSPNTNVFLHAKKGNLVPSPYNWEESITDEAFLNKEKESLSRNSVAAYTPISIIYYRLRLSSFVTFSATRQFRIQRRKRNIIQNDDKLSSRF